MPAGRPSKLDPTWRETAAAHLEQGGSLTALATRLGLSPRTLHKMGLTKATARTNDEAPRVAFRPTPLAYSLGAWGVPLRPIASSLPQPQRLTADEVDDRLYVGAMA